MANQTSAFLKTETERTVTKLTIIGLGKVGASLIHLLQDSSYCKLSTVVTNKKHSSKKHSSIDELLQNKTIEIKPYDQLRHLSGIVAITTPDSTITHYSQLFSTQCTIDPDTIIFHCSGLLTSDALSELASKGAFTASLHPVYSFTENAQIINNFKGTLCSFEGHPKALATILPALKEVGAVLYPIAKEHKPSYHAACCIASNYLIGLYALARNILLSLDFPLNDVPKIIIPLMESTLGNIYRHHATHQDIDLTSQNTLLATKVLTGPIARGDYTTIAAHLEHLPPLYKDLYQALGKMLIQQLNLSPSSQILQYFASDDRIVDPSDS
jgi:predicted short-subunit dehydrogenase-like oxidoreductase (DUF2520 family)